jgi:hypothetical protein
LRALTRVRYRCKMQAADGVRELQSRISKLDTADIRDYGTVPLYSPDRKIAIGDAHAFISVLRHVTSNGRHDETPIASSPDADAIIGTCRLIGRLGTLQPSLVSGGIGRLPQYWISAVSPPWLPPRKPMPSRDYFIPPSVTPSKNSGNPFGMGLYTSTGFQNSQGMWRIYLDFDGDSATFLKPWQVWRLHTDAAAKIRDITTAADWEELVLHYPAFTGGLIYPDWRSIAEEWDAVHITVRAIAAIQGIRLRTPRGLLGPSYWDVETTFWLNWRFSSVTHVETVEVENPIA